jgi:hypothetical protein
VDLLSFKLTGRPISLDAVGEEFSLMQGCLKKRLTVDVARRICAKSGSHLLKLVSPRVDGDHAILRFDAPDSNRRSSILPSTNAPDIPFCKVVYRPLEVIGHPSRSVIDHILNPEDHSSSVLDAFAGVFGADVLAVMQEALLAAPNPPLKLGAGEFPIIFIPRPGGGDLQITPVAQAAAFMGMKRVTDDYFQKATPDGPRPPRGRWTKAAVSSKPQNISGAIGGPRVRFLATMPPGMTQGEAELYRYANGGGFPRWREESVADWILRYGAMLDADATYNNENTRAALNRTADRLIRDVGEFISDTLQDAKNLAGRHGIPEEKIPEPPGVGQILVRRKWASEKDLGRARKALTSPHFEHRLLRVGNSREG